MVLQTEITEVRPWTALRLEIKLALRYRIAVLVVRHFYAIQHNNRARAIQRDLHRVPFWPRFPRLRQRLGQRIQHAGGMVFIFFRSLGMVVDLHFKTVVHWHPLFARLDGNADEYSRSIVLVAPRANVLPPVQIFAIKELLPRIRITLASILIVISSEGERHQTGKHKNRNNKWF